MNSKVLIVDDSSLARRTMRQHLEALGYTVEEASEGAGALERLLIVGPDMVILDMVMTGMTGLEILGQMKLMKPEIKVLVVTADIQDSTANQVRAAGAMGILNKPVQREKLAATLTVILGGGSTWN
jgi:two-component system chemotaxis response regulator CheY